VNFFDSPKVTKAFRYLLFIFTILQNFTNKKNVDPRLAFELKDGVSFPLPSLK
jgi:hypothetical protein